MKWGVYHVSHHLLFVEQSNIFIPARSHPYPSPTYTVCFPTVATHRVFLGNRCLTERVALGHLRHRKIATVLPQSLADPPIASISLHLQIFWDSKLPSEPVRTSRSFMEPHELAVAALQEAAQASSHITSSDQDKVASSRLSPDATGNDMEAFLTANASNEDTITTHLQSARTETAVAPLQTSPDLANSTRQSASSINSQSTIDGRDTGSTPPTSHSDGLSTQSTNQESQLSQLSQLAAAQQPLLTETSPARPSLSIPPTVGQKRTADGEVKPFSLSSPQGPKMHGHLRTTSGVSNVSSTTSRIGEVRLELFCFKNVADRL